MKRCCLWVVPVILALGLTSGCQSVYYSTLEQFGVYKRDILVDRVKEARDSQQEAKKEFASALEQFKSVVKVDGGELEAKYNKLNAALQKSESEAANVRKRIKSVEDVSEALFSEWEKELKQYHSETLRNASREKLDATRRKYEQLIGAMKKAEAKLEPVLIPLRDQVLFLKHNLNAKAISSLGGELQTVQGNVDSLIRDMEASIAEADAFIKAMAATE